MNDVPRRHLAAVMFTDLVNYTALMQRAENAAVDARSRHRDVLYRCVPEHGGEIVQFMGDGSVCKFSSAVEAVRAAVDIQAFLSEDPRLPLRIGIHQGDVTYDEQGLLGDSVNIAARMQALAVPGGIAITEKVVDEIRNHPELTALGMGEVRLKGVVRPMAVYAVAAPGVVVPEATDVSADLRATIDGHYAGGGFHRRPGHSPAARPVPEIPPMPLVGREPALSTIRSTFDSVEAGLGRTLLLSGESGVGKTRLAEAARDEARQRGWGVAVGRANQVETDLPYALLADALLPTIENLLQDDTRAAMAGGVLDELVVLFPTLARLRGGGDAPSRARESTDFRNRLFWNFAQFLEDLGGIAPLLVVLEDLHWADTSSLELFHFLARQTTSGRVAFVATCRDDRDSANAGLRDVARSLIALGVAENLTVRPLTYTATDELVRKTFGIPETVSRPFTGLLFGWTRGNPFFVEELLKTLVDSGSLHREGDTWLGWELDELELPESVRETVALRASRLSAPARRVAELAAVIGGRFRFDQMGAVAGLSAEALLPVIDELEHQRIIVESEPADAVSYEFAHPIVRETLYAGLGRARAGVLHGAVAQALERFYDAEALSHAGELAYHFARALDRSLADKAVRFLEAAGRAALSSRANPEALKCLRAALDRVDAGVVARTPVETARLIGSLAHAHQRLGETELAIELWSRARGMAEAADDAAGIARVERRLGLAHYWAGRAAAALEHFEAGAAAARRNGDVERLAMLQVARGLCLQELGRADEALAELEAALEQAKIVDEPGLLARVHRALLLIYLWTGPAELAASHGRRALELVELTDEVVLSFWVHWAMALLSGLTGDAAGVVEHVTHCDAVAEDLRSPLLRMWSAEISVEFLFAVGRWDEGLAIGENAINVARALNQTTLLPRLLVWTALIHLGRNDLVRGKAYLDEAWALARVDASGPRTPAGPAEDAPVGPGIPSVHVVITAHIGRAALHLASDDHAEAIAVAEAGLEVVDRTGYDVWAVHRLLPIALEASLYMREMDRANRYGSRLRASAEHFRNRLGLAWADACDALTVWLNGDASAGAEMMKQAVVALEGVPYLFDAARLRRQLAGRLADMGDRDGALRELRTAHESFLELGAEKELERIRLQFRELEARPPSRHAPGAAGLTGRELEVARALARNLSNKAIAKELKISVRTVTTHVSNIYRKLGIGNRSEVAGALLMAEQTGDVTRR